MLHLQALTKQTGNDLDAGGPLFNFCLEHKKMLLGTFDAEAPYHGSHRHLNQGLKTGSHDDPAAATAFVNLVARRAPSGSGG
jgi:hypothetical protein